MIKKIFKILFTITLLFTLWIIGINAEVTSPNIGVADVSVSEYDQRINSDNRLQENWLNNPRLNKFWWSEKNFIKAGVTWESWLYLLIIKIAQSIKDIFLILATVYFLIIVLKLLFSEWSSEEEWWKFKKWIIWITIWIMLMQIAYSYVFLIYNRRIWPEIAWGLISWIIEPLLKLLETSAAFFFIMIMIFSFYKIITAGWEEEKAKQWKMSVLYAFVGFLVIRVSSFIVSATYSQTLCEVIWVNCDNEKDLSDWAQIIFTVINWLNWFVWIAVVIMIIYAWSQIIFSNWEDEKIKKAKNAILYIIIWIVLLIVNYFILTFFLTPELIQ